MNRSLRRIILTVVLLVLLGAAAVLLAPTLPGEWRERLAGESPQAEISAYMKAILRGDRRAALDRWEVAGGEAERTARLERRREQVTGELLGLGASEFTVFEPQWWTTCCEPHVTCTSRSAGGARVQVQVLDRAGMPQVYVFDVFSREQPYWGDAMGSPPRDWVVRDVYALDQEPLYWRAVYESSVRWLGEPAE